MTLLLTLLSCIEDRPPPFVGDCADYPQGVYDFGEIGIGRCLAGPLSLHWSDDGSLLSVVNANPFLDFTGGSVATIDVGVALGRAPVDPDRRVVIDDEVVVGSLGLTHFPSYGELVRDRGLLLVPTRYTDGGRTRIGLDDLYFVDLSDPSAPAFANIGPNGEPRLELLHDPALAAYDAASGLAYVENLTDHSLSVIDLSVEPVEILDAVPAARATGGRFLDLDVSGSRVELASVEITDAETVYDQTWSLTFAEGTTRLWVPEGDGVARTESYGGEQWRASGDGLDLDPADVEGLYVEFLDPQPYEDGEGTVSLMFADQGDIAAAAANGVQGTWGYFTEPFVTGREGEWDATLGGPMPVLDVGVHYLFFDGSDGAGAQAIGLATSTDAVTFRRETPEPVLQLDGTLLADPHVVWDDQGQRWTMLVSMDDGSGWTIGRAISSDLYSWSLDEGTLFVPDDGAEAASAVMAYTNAEWRMWTARRGDAGVWELGVASSPDGDLWTDLGVVSSLDWDGEQPPGVGLLSNSARSFLLSGDSIGATSLAVRAGSTLSSSALGFDVLLSSGALAGPQDAPDEGVNGVRVDSYVDELGLAYLTLTDAQGQTHVGLATWDGERLRVEPAPLFSPGQAPFDGSVSSPVVFQGPSGWAMLLAGQRGARTSIALATSPDGVSWTMGDLVYEGSADWESLLVSPGSVVVTDQGYELWFTGSDGSRSRIGLATSPDLQTWTPVPGAEGDWQLGTGAPGDFDDSAVRHPSVLQVDGVEHLWYAGFDGDFWTVGHASRELGAGTFERTEDLEGEPRAVLTGLAGSFDEQDVYRPVVRHDEQGYRLFYAGRDAATERAGQALGVDAGRLYRDPARPTTGDRLDFDIEAGDGVEGFLAIQLAREVEGYTAQGLAASYLLMDEARGFLYVASKLHNYIYVIDVRDDSTDTWTDANYQDIEALFVANTDVGARAFRGMLVSDDGSTLYALNTFPESVMLFDLDAVVDDDRGDVLPDAVIGYLPAGRALERDQGSQSDVSIGPAQLVQVGDHLIVSNFNLNSLSVYDLRLGVFGAWIDELRLPDENPHALAVSPDGTQLAVANYVGEIVDGRASSSVLIVDIDPGSDTYLQVLARVVNQ